MSFEILKQKRYRALHEMVSLVAVFIDCDELIEKMAFIASGRALYSKLLADMR